MNIATTIPNFDCAELPEETANSLRESADAIRAIQRNAVVDVGKHLLRAKETLRHGAFSTWVEAEIGITVRSAERYMRTAQFLAGKPDTMSLLPPSILYRLAAPSVPVEVLRDVVTAAEVGTTLATEIIMEGLGRAVHRERELKLTMPRRRITRDDAKKLFASQQVKREREMQAQKVEEQTRANRLAPLVARVMNALGDTRPAVLEVMKYWQEEQAFFSLLKARLQAEAQT
jgi:hypothetical protein